MVNTYIESFVQDTAGGFDGGVQFLDSSGCALCTDRRQAASAALVCNRHDHYQTDVTAVLLWLPQQCHAALTTSGLLCDPGQLAFPSGMGHSETLEVSLVA